MAEIQSSRSIRRPELNMQDVLQLHGHVAAIKEEAADTRH